MNVITIYTDGACANNQSQVNYGGWGAVLTFGEHVKELYGGQANTTNNRMELISVIEALKALKTTDKPIKIYSDSAYTVNCFKEKWYVGWLKNGWKNSQKKPVENQDLWMELLDLINAQASVQFFKLKGHLDTATPSEKEKWRKKLEVDNKEHYTTEDFERLTQMNILADALANKGIEMAKLKSESSSI